MFQPTGFNGRQKMRAAMGKSAARLAALVTLLLLPQLGLGQPPPGPQGQAPPAEHAAGAQPSQATTPPPAPLPPGEAKVLEAYRAGHLGNAKDRASAGIGDIIVLRVKGLQALLDKAICRDKDGKTLPDCHPQEIALFLDGRRIKDLVPESGAPIKDEGTLRYHLARTADNDEAWADLLGAPPPGKKFWERPTEVSVGLENDYPISTDVREFNLQRVRKGWFWAGLGVVAVLIVLLGWLAKESDILRDSGPDPNGKRKTFSLARCQMAFWFVIIIPSFFFIWLITGASDIITASTLSLIGIASGTALGAAVIDVNKQQGAPDPKATENFLIDILSDANGISFHRFQMLGWTLVLAVLFVHDVWRRLAMPDFPGTLMALQGISAGTYLGFKIPEQ